MWLLRDPLGLTNHQLILPQAMAPLLALCDGERDVAAIHAAFCNYAGGPLPQEIITDALEQLDKACLLDNERAKDALEAARAAYRAQPYRPPALAGLSYPEEPAELSHMLAGYGGDESPNGRQPWRGRGIVSPHIDYERGGHVYAKVWRRAEAAVQEADLALIFGTDHNGSPGALTLTRQPYATPFGLLPTDEELVEHVAAAIGPENAFAEELHHRQEHSVELSAVWLHWLRRQNPCPMIPILCGSFQRFIDAGRHPDNDELLAAAVAALQEATAGKRVLVVASVDLAHVGPNFGDAFAMDQARRQALVASDGRLIEAILGGDAGRFYHEIASAGDRNRICGFSAIYLMLHYLGQTRGIQVAYDHCPADPQNNSLVSICGLLLE